MIIRQEAASGWDPTASPTFWINDASRVVMRRFEERLRPLGFGMAYFRVIVTLEAHGMVQQKDLLKVIQVEQPTMAVLLKRMERDRFIARKPDPNDSRAQLIGLTSRARVMLGKAKTEMSNVVEQAMTGISAKDREVMVRALKTVVMNLGGDMGEETGLDGSSRGGTARRTTTNS